MHPAYLQKIPRTGPGHGSDVNEAKTLEAEAEAGDFGLEAEAGYFGLEAGLEAEAGFEAEAESQNKI